MRTKAIEQGALSVILAALTPENRLVCTLALRTGLRVSDVLNLKTRYLHQKSFTIREMKTGKARRITLTPTERLTLAQYAGKAYIFTHRTDPTRPRTRQAVWKDLNRVAKLLRLKGLAPHSMRKTYAKDLKAHGFSDSQIQKALNHSDVTITYLYTLADELSLHKKPVKGSVE